jgi:hypothetical protein
MEARYGSNGSVRSAHFDRGGGAQMNVSHGMHGERRIETVRADHTRVVSWGPRRGYVERPFRAGYVSRTYVLGERTYVHVYRTHYFRGVAYYGYVPPVYYGPGFYGWAANPWPAPAAFAWGWAGSPWLGYYGSYFAPAPAYPTAALWLTDHLLAENLELAWENQQALLAAQQAAAAASEPVSPSDYSPGAAILTPEVKLAIADEIRQQIAGEYAAANQPASQSAAPAGEQAPAALAPNQRIFVVSTSFALNAGGQDCALTPGDILARSGFATVTARNTVSMSVLRSKPGNCPVNTTAEIDLTTLEEMHNQFLEQVDNGLKILADNQGQGGLPAGPPPQARPALDGQAPVDTAESVQTELAQQQQDASRALEEVQRAAAGS